MVGLRVRLAFLCSLTRLYRAADAQTSVTRSLKAALQEDRGIAVRDDPDPSCISNDGCQDMTGDCCPNDEGNMEDCCSFVAPLDPDPVEKPDPVDPSVFDEVGFFNPLQNSQCFAKNREDVEIRKDVETSDDCVTICRQAQGCLVLTYNSKSKECALMQSQRCKEVRYAPGFVTFVKNTSGITSTRLPTIKIESSFAHMFAIGDWGSIILGPARPSMHYAHKSRNQKGTEAYDIDHNAQQHVADAMAARADKVNPFAVINVGDSFYWGGIENPLLGGKGVNSWQWTQGFENVYKNDSLKVPWLSVLGNHDWGGDACIGDVQAQIDYTWKDLIQNDRWKMPGPYYSQRVDFPTFSVEIFMLDSNKLDSTAGRGAKGGGICAQARCEGSLARARVDTEDCIRNFTKLWDEQQVWLEDKLNKSNATWKFIAAHHKPNPDYYGIFIHKMAKQYGVQLVLGGHTHETSLEISSDERTNVMCIGQGGGAQAKPGCGDCPKTGGFCGTLDDYSFGDMNISEKLMTIRFHRGHDQRELYQVSINPLGTVGPMPTPAPTPTPTPGAGTAPPPPTPGSGTPGPTQSPPPGTPASSLGIEVIAGCGVVVLVVGVAVYFLWSQRAGQARRAVGGTELGSFRT